jgi:hypothetical protein
VRLKIRRACGIALIVMGLVAIPVPIVPGVPLIVAGAALLGPNHPFVRTGRAWLARTGLWKTEGRRDELPGLQSELKMIDRQGAEINHSSTSAKPGSQTA